MSDLELLGRCRAGDEEALATLAERHYRWVYAAARRQVGDVHTAQDVAQAVFVVLMRKAPVLRSDSVLAAWLFQVTRFAAKRALRSRRRRTFHEGRAAAMRSHETIPDPEEAFWVEIRAQVDDAVSSLGRADREAVLLRFYQGRTFGEVGLAMGISEEAARKRVTRALLRLRSWLGRRGVRISTELLGPAMLKLASDAAAVKAAALAPTGAAAGAVAKGAMSMITMTTGKLMTAIGAAVLLTAATTTVVMRSVEFHGAQPVAGPTGVPNISTAKVVAISQSGPVLADDLLQIGIGDLMGPGILTHVELRVDGSGQVSPPLLKPVDIKNATLAEAELKISGAYGAAGLISHADVSIRRLESGAAPSVRSGPAKAGDWLRIDIADLKGPGVITEVTDQVTDEGGISLPLIGLEKVRGQSEAEICQTLKKAYQSAGIFSHANLWILKITPEQAALVPKERTVDGRNEESRQGARH